MRREKIDVDSYLSLVQMKAYSEFEQQTMQLIALPISSANLVFPEKTRKAIRLDTITIQLSDRNIQTPAIS